MNYNEVYESSLEYFDGDELAAKVFVDKYALRDNDGNFMEKTPEDMHRRLAKEFARIEKDKFKNPLSEDEIFSYLDKFKYIVPQGSPMFGIGNKYQYVSISNCFVLTTPDDSYGSILATDEELVQVSKRRGGVGIDVSKLRPSGSPTNNAARTSTGVTSFMERYSNSINEVGQNARRGALMLTISCHHPDILKFVNVKRDLKKVTGANISVKLSNEFLNAVKNDTDYELRFPVDARENGEELKISQMVKAKDVWNEIVENARNNAEPGILFWDNIIENSPADSYKDFGFNSVSTNPCIVGDTIVALADGRNNITIKELSEIGDDVDVYCLNENGELIIRKMRNPRLTGYNQQIYKVNIEGGHSIRVTGNHKFRLKNGEYVETKNLKKGDSLHILTKWESPIVSEKNKSKNDYIWVNNSTFKSNTTEHKLIAEYNNNKKINFGEIVHHIDYDTKNNKPENLKIMTKIEHDKLHSQDMIGCKNPYHRMTDEWKNNFHDSKGKSNSRYINIENEELIEHAKKLTLEFGRRFSKREWMRYAKQNNLPQSFSNFRKEELGSIDELSKKVAHDLNFEFINKDTRLVNTYNKAIENGYESEIINNKVFVTKCCEECKQYFKIDYFHREISFCSIQCSNISKGKNQIVKEKRTNSLHSTYSAKMDNIKENQIKIYKQLEFDLNRKPLLTEWENQCKQNNISYRLRTKFGFKSYNDLQIESEYYNHKIISVELDGFENVYNGTVDDYHNFFVGDFKEKTKANKPKSIYINNLNCGEIPLCELDSCRLTVLNSYSYVDEPFTENAIFNFSKFFDHVVIAQRLMDDIVDLELEAIDRIINKVKNDPESDYIKQREITLWEGMKTKAIQGRRTGLGLTAVGDTLAALNIGYATDDSIDFIDELYRTLKFGAYFSSVEMAKELGAFPIFNYELEKDNKFLNRINDEYPSLYEEMKKYGRRNIACLTTAPGGSISILCGNSSGVEPLFMMSYTRRKKINEGDALEHTVDFVDELGIKWQEFKVYHPKIKEWMRITGETDETKSPWSGYCAEDLNWKNRVRLQATAQSHICHSISSTINLPEDVTVEQVKEIYETVWESGCKGITIYRKNSRSGVLVESPTKKEEKSEFKNSAPKRPKTLQADVHHFRIKGVDYYVTIGLNEGSLYEIFVGENHEDEDVTNDIKYRVPKKVKNGIVEKVKRGCYNLITEDDIYRLTGNIDNDDIDALTRMISTSLRHGIDVSFIVQQLEKIKGFDNFPKALAKALKKYIKDGTKVSGETCPSCNSKNLIRQDGCVICAECGWTKC